METRKIVSKQYHPVVTPPRKARISRLFIKQCFQGCWLGLLLSQSFFYQLIHRDIAQKIVLDQDTPVQMPVDPLGFADINALNQVSDTNLDLNSIQRVKSMV